MGFRLIGNHAQLDKWINQLSNASSAVMRKISAAMAEESITLVAQGFRKKQDPNGGAWAPRKSGGGGRALLVDTGALRNSFHTKGVSSKGFTVASGVAYSEFHQSGTSRMVARKMVPGANEIPARWAQAYDDVVEDILDEELGE
jgi:phage gpG-like protein